MNVEHEVKLLVEQIKRLGIENDVGQRLFTLKIPHLQRDADGKYCVKFGVLFNDDQCANIFEALVGTLRAAKRKKIISYDGELLLQGVHDNVEISLLQSD